MRSIRVIAALIAIWAASISQTSAGAGSDTQACEDVKSIGSAFMDADGTIMMRLRSLPPGPIGEGQFTYKPDDRDYKAVLDHLGGLKPGDTKPVRPWCGPNERR